MWGRLKRYMDKFLDSQKPIDITDDSFNMVLQSFFEIWCWIAETNGFDTANRRNTFEQLKICHRNFWAATSPLTVQQMWIDFKVFQQAFSECANLWCKGEIIDFMTSDDAHIILEGHSPGTFLLRFPRSILTMEKDKGRFCCLPGIIAKE